MAEVPPFLFGDEGDFASPYEYTVPGSGEVQPYTATATYNNASGQAILPALRIKSASGNLLSLTFPVGETIADGDSAEVTFVPPFGSAGGSSTPATPTTLTYAFGRFTYNQVITTATETILTIDRYVTNDAAGYTQNADSITVEKPGVYFVGAMTSWQAGSYPKYLVPFANTVPSFPFPTFSGSSQAEVANATALVNAFLAANPTIHSTFTIAHNDATFNAHASVQQTSGVNKTVTLGVSSDANFGEGLYVLRLGTLA